MQTRDFIRYILVSVIALRLRSILTSLGIAIGIAAVVLLTSLGEGVHQFILTEFTQFGTNIISVARGKTNTTGISGAIINNVRPLTIDDAEALKRIPSIEHVIPIVNGNALVEAGKRQRRTMVLGVSATAPQAWKLKLALGESLPEDNPTAARAFALLGSKAFAELFPKQNPLGQRIRIAGERYRVIGVLEPKGQLLNFDLDDAVYIPVSKSLEMFNRESLMQIDIIYTAGSNTTDLSRAVKKLLIKRHSYEDFTVISQDQMLESLSSILNILTLAVGALGGISLLVGGVGIFTIMTIAVKERSSEVGLLRAIGATRQQILALFIGEAIVLSALGGVIGLVLGISGAKLLSLAIPALPTYTSWFYAVLAIISAACIGLIAGILPARQAAKLDPVESLRSE